MNKFSGHGNAVAQAYNHMIMPLANRRDKYTQILWGVKDFQKRFRRFPEGMWLPETAVDTETLEVMVNIGIKFTILTQRQAKRIRPIEKKGNWRDVSGEKIDPTMGYLCVLPSGRTINLFFYDGPISQEVSFGNLLTNGEAFAKKLRGAFNDQRTWPQIVNIATDGETFGHHHRHGEMALSYCLHYIESSGDTKVTNFGEYIEKHPPTHVVEIHEDSSWSCIHGMKRWTENCGCNTGMHPGWTQAWRGPLRNAMNWLRDKLIPLYGDMASQYFKNPWETRNDYIEVILDRSHENVEEFFKKSTIKELSREEKIHALKLLEMQRNAMLMYTSCGWFFDEVSGIETVQVMSYASKALHYAEELQGLSLESEYVKYLGKAPSNVFENGAKAYEMFVKPAKTDLIRVGAHYSISSIFEEYPEDITMFCYSAKSEVYNRAEAGKLKLALGKAKISSEITWDEKTIIFAVLHLGDHNINGGTKDFTTEEEFTYMQDEIGKAFEKGDVPEIIRFMDKHFNSSIYSLWHLFRDEQRKVLYQILQLTFENIENSYRHIYEDNYAIMNFFHNLNVPLPKPFSSAAGYILDTDLKKIFDNGENIDIERFMKLIDDARRLAIKVDTTTIGFIVSSWVENLMDKLKREPENTQLFDKIDTVMKVLKPLSLSLDLWKAQNIYFSMSKDFYNTMKNRAERGEKNAKQWVEYFINLGNYLHVKVL
jgi:alpha-amylase/alpha-mannosidase (GH57 family)